MASISNQTPAATYPAILLTDATGTGLTGSLKVIQDGAGNSSALSLSTAQVSATGPLLTTISTALTATGSTQGTALAITSSINQVTGGAANTGVILTNVPGTWQIVDNGTSGTIKVYGNTSSAINSLSTNAAYLVPAGASVIFFCISASQWYTAGLDYSVANSFSGTQTFVNATLTGTLVTSTAAAVAAAGSTQGGATALTVQNNYVNSGSGGVALSTAAGSLQIVTNDLGGALNVYPPSSAAINALSTNAAYSMASGTTMAFLSISSTVWVSLGVDPTVATTFTNPTFTTPTLGAATATTINKVTITQPASSATLTIATGKTLTASNTLTLAAGADSQTWTFPSTSDTVATIAATQTFTNKTLTTPVINGLPTGTGIASAATASTVASRDSSANLTANNHIGGYTSTATAAGTTTLTVASTYQQVFTGSTTQICLLPVVSTLALGQQFSIQNLSTGVVTVQSSGTNNILLMGANTSATFTTNASSGTSAAVWNYAYNGVVTASGKVLTVNNSITLAGTDGVTATFPSASFTAARTDAGNTFSGTQTFGCMVQSANAIAAVSNAATVPITTSNNVVTNSSAATLTITLTTGAVDKQMTWVSVLDATGASQTITWVNTENSTGASVPTTSNGSTTLPKMVLFVYNSLSTKWRCALSC